MDMLVSNIMGNSAPITRPQVSPTAEHPDPLPSEETKDVTDEPWKHFSFICSIELIDKVQAIAHKEGFTIRAFMEYMMRQGIDQYIRLRVNVCTRIHYINACATRIKKKHR